MPPRTPHLLSLLVPLMVVTLSGRAALGDESWITSTPQRSALALAANHAVAPIAIAPDDWPGVRRAARDLQSDFERVTGLRPGLATPGPSSPAAVAILAGTLGHSTLIDALVRTGKIDPAGLAGKWESFLIQTVDRPAPGIDHALVIVGSDKRGTIYGLYEVSQQIGVSPWYWWADVTPDHRDALYAKPVREIQGEPSVKYRGVFLNDEAPDLTNWVRAKFGTAPLSDDPPVPAGVANYNHEFYARLFEVLLRLRANYLWPAMWNNAFNEDDRANAQLADEYGIVMGTSHQEPMLRAQKEWDRRYLRTIGPWNYAQHPDVMESFWREGIRRNKNFESIVTLGLRGANDTPMAPGGPDANRALLESIVGVQRRILREEVNPDLTKVPQLWCLYKEVQDYYDAGLRVPDDVTLLWAEDNWGNVRRLPTAAERARPGGAGVYYHFDYHGGPRSYQWLNSSPIARIWDQLSLAQQYGADRIWMVNVGHFKGYEFPTEYFLSLAWDTHRWSSDKINSFTRLWAAREFGPDHVAAIADLMAKVSKYNGRRKPELLEPGTYSLTDYREAETVVADYRAVAAQAEEIFRLLPPAKRDAFYGLVLFPAKAGALVNALYLAAGRNALFASQGRATANECAAETQRLFQAYLSLVASYDTTFAAGRWAHFMDQPVLGYTSWRDPPANNLNHLKLAEVAVPPTASLGVSVEGSSLSWSGATAIATLPKFDSINRQHHYLEVFRRGQAPLEFTATPSAPWIVLGKSKGTVSLDERIWVSIDWTQVPHGTTGGTVTITSPGTTVTVKLEVLNSSSLTCGSLDGFVEREGYVSIEPEHYSKKVDAGTSRWTRIEDYGRTLSGLRADGPVDAPAATPGRDAPCLEYRMYLFGAGPVDVTAITGPTLNFIPGRDVRYAAAFDDEPPQIITLVPSSYRAQNGNRAWEKSVSDNAHLAHSRHTVAHPGYHTLKIWMVDPGVVLQKLVVDLGGVKPSYLGPPESFYRFAPSTP